MSYKAILIGILLLLAAPPVSSAQEIFLASASGTEICNGVASKLKETIFVSFDISNFIIAKDKAITAIIATTQESETFIMSTKGTTTTAGFIYDHNDTDSAAVFAGSLKADQGLLVSFTGTLDVINRNTGCFDNLTIKSKGIAP